MRELAPPENQKELRSFLGTAPYFASFIDNFPDRVAPLREAANSWKWEEPQARAFADIRNAIASEPVLAQFKPGAQIIVRGDASGVGVGGAVFQKTVDGNVGVLCFFGRKLNDAEMSYGTIELEALAVLLGLQHARKFITREVVVITDHSNLTFMRSSANPRIQRWRVAMGEFSIIVLYRPGDSNVIADCISRMVPHEHHRESKPLRRRASAESRMIDDEDDDVSERSDDDADVNIAPAMSNAAGVLRPPRPDDEVNQDLRTFFADFPQQGSVVVCDR